MFIYFEINSIRFKRVLYISKYIKRFKYCIKYKKYNTRGVDYNLKILHVSTSKTHEQNQSIIVPEQIHEQNRMNQSKSILSRIHEQKE